MSFHCSIILAMGTTTHLVLGGLLPNRQTQIQLILGTWAQMPRRILTWGSEMPPPWFLSPSAAQAKPCPSTKERQRAEAEPPGGCLTVLVPLSPSDPLAVPGPGLAGSKKDVAWRGMENLKNLSVENICPSEPCFFIHGAQQHRRHTHRTTF